ncbi:hypothetical protein RB600_001856 [Gaeumannomyces tritici]
MAEEGIDLFNADQSWEFGATRVPEPSEWAAAVAKGSPAYQVQLTRAVLGNITATHHQLSTHEPTVPALDEEDEEEPAEPLDPRLQAYADVFSSTRAKKLPLLEGAEHAIELEEGTRPPVGGLYPTSEKQSAALKEYLEENLAWGRVNHSEADAGSPVLFVPKKDGSLRLCVDYRALNRITRKNRYPLPLISDLMDRLAGAKWFSKMDLRDAYHRIRIRPEDRWKTAFRTKYGLFEYTVMPFGLTNAPSTFQAYMHRALAGLIDHICVVYLDDIIVFSQTEEEHEQHVKQILDRLRLHELYAKQSKCEFFQDHVEFLGFRVSREGISMDPDRTKAIQEWQPPESYRDIQVFLGFANFYRKFIPGYSRVVAPMTGLLKGSQNGKKKGMFDWPPAAARAFEGLKAAFGNATILRHWDPTKETRVETDASTKAISGILSQLTDGRWHPVAFYSRKLTDAEQKWATGQQELLAIIESLEHWRQYLEGASKVFTVLTDHQALKGVIQAPARDLRGRLARWVYRLSQFDFNIEHRSGKTNPADGLSRRPDYMGGEITYEDVVPSLAAKLNLLPHLPGKLTQQIAALTIEENSPDVIKQYVQAAKMIPIRGRDPQKRQRARLKGSSHGVDPLNYLSRVDAPMEGKDEEQLPSRPRPKRARSEVAESNQSLRPGLQMAMQIPIAALTRAKRRERQVEPGPEGDPERLATAQPRAEEELLAEELGAGSVVHDQLLPRPVIIELMKDETARADEPGRATYQLVRRLQTQDQEVVALRALVKDGAGILKDQPARGGDAARSRDAVKKGDATRRRDAACSRDAAEKSDAMRRRDAVRTDDAALSRDAVGRGDAALSRDAAQSRDAVGRGDAALSRDAAQSRDAVGRGDAALSRDAAQSRDAVGRGDAAPSRDAAQSRDAVGRGDAAQNRDAVGKGDAARQRDAVGRGDAAQSRDEARRSRDPHKGYHVNEDGFRSFLVKWAGWPAEYNTWEPEEHLDNAQKLVKSYLKKKRKTHRKWDDPTPGPEKSGE